ncbi:MAG: alpha amylase, partial [Lachnospiraceae bacterium]|nr:alpha amylase [Lachnospiraceae bacterium]
MQKRFGKRPLGIVMAAVMAAQLCACGSTQKSDLQETETSSALTGEESSAVEGTSGEGQTETPDATVSGDGEDGAESAAAIQYDYEQELNIIDDNYRNYYEIFVYSFYDSDGDGIGDLNGVTEKLDYVRDMGFNGIWLMPVMQSPTYHKYDVIDYYSIDKEYGTVEDFQKLVEECHKRDINVVIDFVINHSSSENQWFVEACDYLKALPEGQEPDLAECPYVDYYHFAKEQVNKDYYQVDGSEWYYEGVFWYGMPDLNLASEALRTELEDISRFWVDDMGVDGFRMDAAMHFEENDITFNTETLNWLYSFCKGLNPDFYMVSEVWAGKAVIENYYASMTPSMFNFDAADAEGKLIKAARGNYSAANFVESMVGYQQDYAEKNPDYIDAPFITNHDMGRVANALVKDANNMKMAGGLLMTMNGSPFVYYGEEIGMSSSGQKDENKRLPMIWSDSDTTGMTNGPLDADKDVAFAFAGVEQQLDDSYSILNYYKRAVRLRDVSECAALVAEIGSLYGWE